MFKGKKILAALFAGAAMVASAQANTIYLTTPTVSGSANNWTFTYGVTLQANSAGLDSILHATSSVELLDFLPSSSVLSIAPVMVNTGWALSTTTANGLSSFEDIKLTYTGALDIRASSGSPVHLGELAITTNVQSADLSRFVSFQSKDWESTTTNFDPANYQSANNLNNTVAPGVAVPVPAAAWGGMMLMGVLGGVQSLRRRAMRQA